MDRSYLQVLLVAILIELLLYWGWSSPGVNTSQDPEAFLLSAHDCSLSPMSLHMYMNTQFHLIIKTWATLSHVSDTCIRLHLFIHFVSFSPTQVGPDASWVSSHSGREAPNGFCGILLVDEVD